MCVETCALLRAGAFIIARRYKYGRAIFDTWMRRQLIDIGETVVNNAFGAAPEYGKSGARQRSFARPSASAKRAGTVVLRLRLPNCQVLFLHGVSAVR